MEKGTPEETKLAPYALTIRKRRAALGDQFRLGSSLSTKLPSYRTEYHRDRDRIIWSKAFMRLQHKTQVFPHYLQDHYRRRLTHSLHVAGLATTLARALKLNEVVTEAIALGHDIGHAPFGHAGETALNRALTKLGKKRCFKTFASSKKLPLFGFNHCVHGVEILTRIATRRTADRNVAYGLDLSFDVVDGILKHIYGLRKKGHPFATLDVISSYSEFASFGDNKGSLEAQCVWFADKLAYLMSDIEDGFISNILSVSRIHETMKNIENHKTLSKTLYEDILFFFRWFNVEHNMITSDTIRYIRNRLIDVLIHKAYVNAKNTIDKEKICSNEDVYAYGKRIIHVSDQWAELWSWFYKNIIEKLLFKHNDVYAFNLKCERIVEQLFEEYWEHAELIPSRYREKTQKSYARMGINEYAIIKIIQARNYVAGMTDPYAILQYNKLFTASEPIIPDVQ